jgi:hypothetical protein
MTTSLPHVVPNPKDVKDLFEGLLGRGVTVGESDPVVTADLPSTAMAIYITQRQAMAAVIGLDMPLAAFAGAAVGLIPVGGAEACLEDKVLSPMIAENCREIFNIFSGMLNREGAERVRLHQTFLPGDSPPTDAAALLLAIGRRIDLKVEVAGYGSGRISVSLAP